MATDYGAGIASDHGRLTIKGKDYSGLDYETLASAYSHMSNWRDARGLTTRNSRAETEKLKAAMDAAYPRYMMENYMGAMGEYMGGLSDYLGQMTDAMTREEPAAEPLKNAAAAQDAATGDTARKQLLRRGLMSTYTRYGGQGAAKLGA